MSDTRKRLIKRLNSYYKLEFFSAFFFIYLGGRYFVLSEKSQLILFLYGLTICVFILFQGGYYWYLKLKVLKKEKIDQEKNLKLFRILKKVNEFLIFGVIVIAPLQFFYFNSDANSTNLFWTIVIVVFGVLEYINYYHVQLMIDNMFDVKYVIKNKKLKIASLKKDLIENII